MDSDAVTEGLGPEQTKAVLSGSPYLRIVASAGAGKTETMTRKIVRLLSEGAEPKSIVAFTFTERAAHSIKERIYWRVEKLLGADKCKELGDMYIGTIHAFCLQLLQEHFGLGNFDVMDENQEMAFLMRHGWEIGLQKIGPNYSATCEVFLRSVNVVYDELVDRAKLAEQAPALAADLRQYEELLDHDRLLTFGLIVSLAVGKLETTRLPDLRYLIVDEYQDINRAQERLIWLIADGAECYVVGDPRQCIYEWRGSDPGCFDRFESRYNCETREILENRRSGELIVTVGNKVASQFHEAPLRREMKPSRKFNGASYPGVVLCVEHETDDAEALWIASAIASLKAADVCSYSDIAILLRSVATSGPKILDSLKSLDIPFLVGGRVGLFQRDEARAVGMIFSWCGDMFWRDLYSPTRLTGDALLRTAIGLWPGGASEKLLRQYKEAIRSGAFPSFSDAYNDLLVRLGFLDWDPGDRLVAARMANLGRFSSLLADYEASRRRGGRSPRWNTDLRNLAWFIATYALGAYEEQPADDVRGIDAVLVMTVHQAKGLEWPVVFLPSLVEGRFPSRNAGTARTWLIPGTMFDQARYEGGIPEERKLFYVATTRARDALSLSWFRRIQQRRHRSLFLDEIGAAGTAPPDELFIASIPEDRPDEEELIGFSATELIEYLRCPNYYRLKNLWNYQRRMVAEIGFGKSLHHVLRVLAERARSGDDPVALVGEVLDEHFHLPFGDAATHAVLRRHARESLTRYVADHLADIKSVKEVEARVEFQLTKTAIVTGRVDVIIGSKGELEARDYKSTHADDDRSQEEASFQVRLYAIGLGEVGQPVAQASIANILDNVVEPVGLSQPELERARADAERAVSGILARDFSANPGEPCGDCGYCTVCRFSTS